MSTDTNKAIAAALAFIVILGGGIYMQVDGPCWAFKYSHLNDIPARCIHELVK